MELRQELDMARRRGDEKVPDRKTRRDQKWVKAKWR